MNTIVRLIHPTTGHEAHHHMEAGAWWIEVYTDDKLVARFLTQNIEAQK